RSNIPTPLQRAQVETPAPHPVLPSEARAHRPVNTRRLFFRALRLALSGALLSSAAFYTREVVEQATSEQAYINGEITGLRAPISGQLNLQAAPGHVLRAGDTIFTIENPRVGNQEVSSQLNWVTESAERLQAEGEETALRFKQQEEVYR